MSARFITLEGVEGVGKSTQLSFIEQRLRSAGHDVVVTREPGGTQLGERLREWLLDRTHAGLSAEVEALLMFAARAHHLDQVIRPALARGSWVVCDRFSDATFAYQGGGRGADSDFLTCLAATVQRGLEPDLTLLLDAPVEVGMQRIRDRAQDRFERENSAFFERVRAAYHDLARLHPQRIRKIDATRAPAAVEREIDVHLTVLLSGPGHQNER